MKIKVTKKHIDAGKKGACQRCPIALAILEQTDLCKVMVGGDEVEGNLKVNMKGEKKPLTLNMTGELPAKAHNFIEAFDSGDKVKPFSFNLRLIPERF